MPGGAAIGSSVGGLLGGVAILAGAGGKGGKKEHKQALDVWKKLQLSDFDYRALSPPELQVLAQAMPEVYQAVVPENFQGVADSATGRAGQVQSLAQMQQIAGEGLPLVDRLQAQKAAGAVTSAASAAQTDALRRMAARGQLGGGDQIQAELAGSQQGANLARDLGSDLATQAALRRMSAIGQSGQMAGQLRSGDVDVAARNADIANRFSELIANMKTRQAESAAGARERAQAYNVRTAQDVGNTNRLNAYQTALENLNRTNQLRSTAFRERLAKTGGLSGAYTDYGNYKDAQKAAKEQAIMNIGQGAGGAAGSIIGGGF